MNALYLAETAVISKTDTVVDLVETLRNGQESLGWMKLVAELKELRAKQRTLFNLLEEKNGNAANTPRTDSHGVATGMPTGADC